MHAPKAGVVVVGSGWHFTSGISYYTCRLANALAESGPTTAVLMRALIPRRLYPGAARVGTHQPALAYDPRVAVVDGVDWWGRGLLTAVRRLWRADPETVVLQWWTGAVLHSYLVLAAVARLRGARVVLELHEVQDTGEAGLPLVARYTALGLRPLHALVHGFVVHSAHDRDVVRAAYKVGAKPVEIALHGPFDHHVDGPGGRVPPVPDGQRRVLFFGTVRPYKGAEDVVAACELLDDPAVQLAVVGETWEGWTAPDEAIAASAHPERVLRVEGYVSDADVAAWFASADVVVLPYRRSSASGPLHIAMSAGLPVVVTDVEALREAAGDYTGATFVPVADPEAIRAALRAVLDAPAATHADPRSWADTVAALHRAAA